MEAKAVEEKNYAMEKSLNKKLVAIVLCGDDGGDEATHTASTESTRNFKIKNHFRLHLCTVKRPLSFYCNLCEGLLGGNILEAQVDADSQLQIVMKADIQVECENKLHPNKMLATPLGMQELFRNPRHRVLANFRGAANPQNQNNMDIDGIHGGEGQHGNGEEGGDGHGEGGQNEDDQEDESEDEPVDDEALEVYEAEHAEGRIFARHHIGQVPSERITGPVTLHYVLQEMLAERIPEAELPLWNIVYWSARENDRERELLCPRLTMSMNDFNRLLHGVDFVKIPYEDLYIFEEQGHALIIERLKEDGETLLLEECFATIIPGTYQNAQIFEEAVKAAVHRCWVQYPQLANLPVDPLPDNYQLLYYTRLSNSEMREISISMEWDFFCSLLWGAFVCDSDPAIDLFKLQDAEVPLLQYWEDGN